LELTGGGGKSDNFPPFFSMLPAILAYLIAAINSSCFCLQFGGLAFCEKNNQKYKKLENIVGKLKKKTDSMDIIGRVFFTVFKYNN
jgi:hypothetical protein